MPMKRANVENVSTAIDFRCDLWSFWCSPGAKMKTATCVLLFVALAGCGGSNEVSYPEHPTSPPPPGSLSNADEPGPSSDLPVQ